jgi:hypothetical protein
LTPYGFGLRLHTGHGTEDCDGAIQDPQASLYFGGEIHMAWGVDDIDAMTIPVARGGGAGNGYASLLLLLHVIHGSGTVVDFAHAVEAPGVVQDTFSNGGLAGIDVGHYPNVSGFI